MKMKITCLTRMGLVVAAAIFLHYNAHAVPINLGTAADFAILSYSGITDAGAASTITTGDVGVTPTTGASITGLTDLQVLDGTIYTVNDAGPGGQVTDAGLLTIARNDLTAAYNDAAGALFTATLPNLIGGDQTLGPGVYRFANPVTVDLVGNLNLSGSGVYVFQVPADLQTAVVSSVTLLDGASFCNVIWQVGSSANLLGQDLDDPSSPLYNFAGTILASGSITLGADVTVNGRLLALNGNVTLIDDTIDCSGCGQPGEDLGTDNPDHPGNVTPPSQSVPDAGSTLLLLGSALVTLSVIRRRFFSPA